jgi:hypothetical protein
MATAAALRTGSAPSDPFAAALGVHKPAGADADAGAEADTSADTSGDGPAAGTPGACPPLPGLLTSLIGQPGVTDRSTRRH